MFFVFCEIFEGSGVNVFIGKTGNTIGESVFSALEEILAINTAVMELERNGIKIWLMSFQLPSKIVMNRTRNQNRRS